MARGAELEHPDALPRAQSLVSGERPGFGEGEEFTDQFPVLDRNRDRGPDEGTLDMRLCGATESAAETRSCRTWRVGMGQEHTGISSGPSAE